MRNITLILTFLLIVSGVFAQNDGKNKDKGKNKDENEIVLPKSLRTKTSSNMSDLNWLFDANLGFTWDDNFKPQISICPKVGIYPFEWLEVAAGPRYEMSFDAIKSKTKHAFGVSAFSEFIIVDWILIDVGYDYLNYAYTTEDFELARENYHALAVALGFGNYITDRIRVYGKIVAYPVHSPSTHYYTNYLPLFFHLGIAVSL